MPTLAELLTIPTRDEILAALYTELAARSFPITNWTTGGVERTIVESIAEALADFSGPLATTVTRWGFLEEAEGDALTVLCRSNFDTVRSPATFAEWTITLSDTGAGGPYIITAGQLWAQNGGGLNYNNTIGGTLPLSGTLVLTFKAESPGSAYNVGPVNILATPLPGVTITVNTLTTSATDEESDEDLRTRAALKWSLLGAGSTRSAYERNVLDSDPEIRRVLVLEDNPSPGDVRVYVAGLDATASAPAVAAANAYLDDDVRRPLCTNPTVLAAVEVPAAITATVTIYASFQAAAAASVSQRLLELYRGKRISEADPAVDKIFTAEILEVLMGLEGAINATLTSPPITPLALGEMATLGVVMLTWVTV
jgi:uncharacterized phage protein gp47/JayE